MFPRFQSKPPTSQSAKSAKRAPESGLTNEPRKRRSLHSPATESSYSNADQWTPAGTPIPIQSRLEQRDGQDQRANFDEDNDSQDHVILSIDETRGNTVGCAYYVAELRTLFCMEDYEGGDADVIGSLKQDIKPTIILVSPRHQGVLEQELSRQGSVNLSENEQPVSPYKIELRPYADFKYEKAVQKLSMLPSLQATTGVKFLVPGDEELNDGNTLPDETDLTDMRGRALHISSCINFDSKISISCAGAIVTYLQSRRLSEYLQGDDAVDDAYAILRLEMFSLRNTMLVNSDTLASLQIIQPETHPNAARQGPGSSSAKESLSIYGLFYHFAKTPQGKQQLRYIFLHPSLDVNTIEERQDAIHVFSRNQNQSVLGSMSKCLGKVKNIRRIMVSLHKGIEGGSTNLVGIRASVWSALLDFCYYIIDLSQALNEVVGIENLGIHRRICNTFDKTEFKHLGKMMFDVVDLDESQNQRRTVIKRGINHDLDRVKDAYDGMDELLQQAAIETASELNLPPGTPVPALNVLYIPQLGFHVLMPGEATNDLPDHGIDPSWERMFRTEKSAFYKTRKMRQMDEDLGDMWGIICDIEIEISHELAQKVLEKEAYLITASDLCGELDALLALTHGAIKYTLTRPKIDPGNIIDIRAGRHLIQELTVPSYVPNDALLAGGTCDQDNTVSHCSLRPPNMLLLTGPNYSGKSVYLKQVALIVYMAQVGSYVPAMSARIGITDKIMTRITARETVSRGLSSFMIDLQQVSWALKAYTHRSLLVLDEFGKGTDTCDGAGLAAGLFSYLLTRGDRAPKVLASTHFHEIFEQDLIAENSPGLGLRQMEVYVEDQHHGASSRNDATKEVTYLYNVIPGRSTLSYGAQCAERNGVPKKVVARACELTTIAAAGEDLVSACSHIPQEEMRDLEDAEQLSRAFFEMDLDSVHHDEMDGFRDTLSGLIDSDSSGSNVKGSRSSRSWK